MKNRSENLQAEVKRVSLDREECLFLRTYILLSAEYRGSCLQTWKCLEAEWKGQETRFSALAEGNRELWEKMDIALDAICRKIEEVELKP